MNDTRADLGYGKRPPLVIKKKVIAYKIRYTSRSMFPGLTGVLNEDFALKLQKDGKLDIIGEVES